MWVRKFESKIVDGNSEENMETQNHVPQRSYSNDVCNAGYTPVRWAKTVAMPVLLLCKPKPAVVWLLSGVISQASRNDLLHSASRIDLSHVEPEAKWLILIASRATVAYIYNNKNQPDLDKRLNQAQHPASLKQFAAEPRLELVGWLGFWLGFWLRLGAADPARVSQCQPLLRTVQENKVRLVENIILNNQIVE